MILTEKSPQWILTWSACPGSRGVGGRRPGGCSWWCWCEETNLVHYSASHFIVGEQSSSLSPDTDNIWTPRPPTPTRLRSHQRRPAFTIYNCFYVQPSRNPRPKMLKDAQMGSRKAQQKQVETERGTRPATALLLPIFFVAKHHSASSNFPRPESFHRKVA